MCLAHIAKNGPSSHWPTAAVISVLITGCPVITKWVDCSAFNISTVVLKDIQQLWECQMYCNHPYFLLMGRPVMKTGITASVGLGNVQLTSSYNDIIIRLGL